MDTKTSCHFNPFTYMSLISEYYFGLLILTFIYGNKTKLDSSDFMFTRTHCTLEAS